MDVLSSKTHQNLYNSFNAFQIKSKEPMGIIIIPYVYTAIHALYSVLFNPNYHSYQIILIRRRNNYQNTT